MARRIRMDFLDAVGASALVFGWVGGTAAAGASLAYLYERQVAERVIDATVDDTGKVKNAAGAALQIVTGWAPFAVATAVADSNAFWPWFAGGCAFSRVNHLAVMLFGAKSAVAYGPLRRGETLDAAVARLGGYSRVVTGT